MGIYCTRPASLSLTASHRALHLPLASPGVCWPLLSTGSSTPTSHDHSLDTVLCLLGGDPPSCARWPTAYFHPISPSDLFHGPSLLLIAAAAAAELTNSHRTTEPTGNLLTPTPTSRPRSLSVTPSTSSTSVSRRNLLENAVPSPFISCPRDDLCALERDKGSHGLPRPTTAPTLFFSRRVGSRAPVDETASTAVSTSAPTSSSAVQYLFESLPPPTLPSARPL